ELANLLWGRWHVGRGAPLAKSRRLVRAVGKTDEEPFVEGKLDEGLVGPSSRMAHGHPRAGIEPLRQQQGARVVETLVDPLIAIVEHPRRRSGPNAVDYGRFCATVQVHLEIDDDQPRARD